MDHELSEEAREFHRALHIELQPLEVSFYYGVLGHLSREYLKWELIIPTLSAFITP